MTHQTGRNDPCPCGSGKKYKHCCLNAAPTDEDETSGVIPRALTWLESRHGRAVREAVDEALFDDLDEEEIQCYEDLDEPTRHFISVQAYEWLLAEGAIQVRGQPRRVADLLLGASGANLNDAQRAWLAELAATPLRLYVVTDVKPGQAMTLCDALDTDAEPVTVAERLGSQVDRLGTTIGLRVMNEHGIRRLSGMMYSFSPAQADHLFQWIRETDVQPLPAAELSFMIRRAWIAQLLEEPELPTVMDYYTNEPLLFVMDHYCVHDGQKIVTVLQAQPDVAGDEEEGWERRIDCDDGQTRIAAGVVLTAEGGHLTLLYQTRRYADEGRNWFEALMGNAVEFRQREILDPATVADEHEGLPPATSSVPDFPAGLATPAIRRALRRIHANWADEPLPALDDRSPREAITTLAGRERVKGLLRTYQHDEDRLARRQLREPVSFQFLWDVLGLAPE